MDTVIPGASRNIFKRRKLVRIIAICLAAALIAGGIFAFFALRKNKPGNTVAQRTTKVVTGNLSKSITGSAPIESSYRSELSPKVTATLEKINCKEGDQVKAGDVLFVLDNTDALLDIENAENSIAQMQLTLDSTSKSVAGLMVKAPYNGQITNIAVKEGDTINKGGTILTITDVSKLDVTLAFSGPAVDSIKVGQKATVYLQDLMLSVDGRVSYKSSKPYTTASGGELYNVEISMDNPGSLKEGMKATAEISAGGTVLESVEGGTLSYVNSKVLKGDAGGTITRLNVRENEFVNAGDVMLQLENDDLLLTSSTNDMKMENLKNQLDIKKKQLSYYSIVAPFDGTITSMGKMNEGDTVKQGETLAVISDMGHLEFSVSIDELDISEVAVGQTVKITADAIEETAAAPLTGKVSKVAMEGSSSNGVTTYPVTITVDDEYAGKLKTGMNIDAEIVISEKTGVLMVPLEAVTKMGNRSFVYVKGTAEQSGGARGAGDMRNGMDNAGQGNENGQQRRWNTSGAAIGRNAGTTSGAAVEGRLPPGDFPKDGFPQGGSTQDSQGGRTNRLNRQEGSTTRGAVQGGFAEAARSAVRDPYYEGATLVPVETGISNDSYIEIVNGLTEGQEVVLPKTSSGTGTGSNNNNQRVRSGVMGGGIGGGMSGGMGGGGFSGGRPGGF